MIVRKANLEDLPVLYQFEQQIVETERPFDCTIKEGSVNYYDLKALILSPQAEVVVAEDNNEIIGSGYAQIRKADDFLKHASYCHLGFMYVKTAYRGQGVNKAILDALIQWSKLQQVFEIRLEVYDENTTAKKAYEKAGFKGHMLEMRMSID